MAKRRRQGMGCGTAVVLVFGFFCLVSLLGTCDSSQRGGHSAPGRKASKPTATDAIYAARQVLKRVLKAPSTAEFPLAEDPSYRVSNTGDRWRVEGQVTAQNSFGVPLRQSWTVELDAVGTDWKPRYIELDDEVYYGSPR